MFYFVFHVMIFLVEIVILFIFISENNSVIVL